MTKRICVFCHAVGITISFDKGKQLRKHIEQRHPNTTKKLAGGQSIKAYRREMLRTQARLGLKS